jgi:hypothetical protein
MRIIILIALAFSSLVSPAFACKSLAKYPEHLWGSTVGWWQPYRVVEIVEAHDERWVAIVKRNFADEAAVGKRIALQFKTGEQAHALCSIALEVGATYLVRSKDGTEPLLISRFDDLNIPSTHPKYDGYIQDLERAEVRPMYVEANSVSLDTQTNRLILRGQVRLDYNSSIVVADEVIDDRSINELVAEGGVLLLHPDRSITRSDRLRLPDDFRDTFRSIVVEPRKSPWR